MKATDQLRDEHKGILLMLAILDNVSTKLATAGSLDKGHLEGMLEFFSVFVDKCHHGKEEDLLFPAYEAVGIPNKNGPISVMLAEHAEGRGYVKNMTEAFNGFKKNEYFSGARIVEYARKYIALLKQHIDKEETVLYPMGDARLTEAKNKELLAGFDKVENERIGSGRHEQFHAMIDKLKNIYLS
jgi:hemerythrin-like domain-containing protein